MKERVDLGDVARSMMRIVNFARCDGARREVVRGADGRKVDDGRVGWGIVDDEWLLVLTCPAARAGEARQRGLVIATDPERPANGNRA